jgi:hypothetical protein
MTLAPPLAKPAATAAAIREGRAQVRSTHPPTQFRYRHVDRFVRLWIEGGQFTDLIVPDRDYFSCPEREIADITSLLTVVGGRVVYGSGDFARFDDPALPPAMPDWSPVRLYGGYAAWGEPSQRAAPLACMSDCHVHRHRHATAWSATLPIADLKGFWGALGCSCWAV